MFGRGLHHELCKIATARKGAMPNRPRAQSEWGQRSRAMEAPVGGWMERRGRRGCHPPPLRPDGAALSNSRKRLGGVWVGASDIEASIFITREQIQMFCCRRWLGWLDRRSFTIQHFVKRKTGEVHIRFREFDQSSALT